MDWTEDAGLYQQFKDWREEVELLLDTVLSHIRSQETKLKYVSLWAGKEARTYLSTVIKDNKDTLNNLLNTLEDWTKPKSDEIAAFTHLRTLNQGNKTLSTFTQEVRRVVDLCNFACVGDCKDRLIKNSIVAGLLNTKEYQQCISEGSSLILNECIKICETEDATCRQVQALCPESADYGDSTEVHKLTQYSQIQGRPNYRGRESFRSGRPNCRGSPATMAWPWRDYRHSPETTCQNCGSDPHKSRRECTTIDQECYYCGGLDISQRYAGEIQTIKTTRLRSTTWIQKNSLQIKHKVSTQPPTTSQMIKQKNQ